MKKNKRTLEFYDATRAGLIAGAVFMVPQLIQMASDISQSHKSTILTIGVVAGYLFLIMIYKSFPKNLADYGDDEKEEVKAEWNLDTPVKSGEYLVTLENNHVTHLMYYPNGGWVNTKGEFEPLKVLAWANKIDGYKSAYTLKDTKSEIDNALKIALLKEENKMLRRQLKKENL